MTASKRVGRDRRIAELVADPEAGTLREIGQRYGLTGSAVTKIAARFGVSRGPIQWPPTCNVEGCSRRHHALGLCERHYRKRHRRLAVERDSISGELAKPELPDTAPGPS